MTDWKIVFAFIWFICELFVSLHKKDSVYFYYLY